jgi:uncharacterized lipoprotein
MVTKYIRMAVAALLVLALAACSTTSIVTPPDRPRLDAPDSVSMKACQKPINLPAGEMTQQDIEKYWGRDRSHQIECAKRHKILADYIRNRDAGLTSTKK